MAFVAFTPVGRNSALEGCHYQFRYDSLVVPSVEGRMSDLATLRLNLLRSAALIATGESCLSRAADKLAPSGTTSRSGRNRWLRLGRSAEFTMSSRRQNGTIATCKRELGQHAQSPVLDLLNDDDAPLWRLVSEDNWTKEGLELLCPQIRNLQAVMPLLWSDLTDETWTRMLRSTWVGGMPSIATATTLWLRLRRAQIMGNPSEYARAYVEIVETSRDASSETCWAVRQILGLMDLGPSLETADLLFLRVFWKQLLIYAQAWQSRIWLRGDWSRAFCRIGMELAESVNDVVGGLVTYPVNVVASLANFAPSRWTTEYCPWQGELDLTVDGASIALRDSALKSRLLVCKRAESPMGFSGAGRIASVLS
jgi:hypothetical protein